MDPSSRGGDKLSRMTGAWVRGPTVSISPPGESGQGLKACGVDQLSRGTRALARGPSCLTRCPLRPVPKSEGPWIVQLSIVIWTQVQVLVVFTSCPGGLGPGSKGPRCRSALQADWCPVRGPQGRPAVPDDSRTFPRARGFALLSRAHWARVRWLMGRPAVLDDSSSGPSSCGDDKLSRVTCDKVAGLRCQPAVPGDSGP